jgi:peroxiredoxin
MKRSIVLLFLVSVQLFLFSFPVFAADHPTLAIGAKAPDFKLPGIDGKTYTLGSFKDAKILVIAFICNHCPTSQAYEQRLIKLTSDYADKGVKVVAINPNNPGSLRYDELGWSDVDDSFEGMKERAKDRHFNFPYLYDGEKQVTANKYGPASTPHVFIFDENRILRYNGRIDDTENPQKTPRSQDARNAIEALLNNTEVPVTVTKVFGCSIKWLEKKDWIDKAATKWAEDPVTLDTIDVAGIDELLKNNSDKLRLINIWSISNKISTSQFSDFVTLSRIYVQRDFEFVNINTDDQKKKDSVLAFLKRKESSGSNYMLISTEKNKFIETVDPNWNGKLPYTLLIEPGGKIVYATQNKIDLEHTRKMIFNNEYIGRLYK